MTADRAKQRADRLTDKLLPPAGSHSAPPCLRRVTYAALFWLFMLGSVVGIALEGVWCLLKKGRWEYHPFTVWGPFCIIYGVGAAAVYWLAALLQGRSLPLQFAAFSISGALVEYFGSLLQEKLFGTVSWDYSDHFLNLGGRVSLQMSLLWGVLGVAFIHLLYSPLTRLLAGMQGKGWQAACLVLSVYMAVNLAVSAAAILRWRARQDAAAPASAAAQWLDETFDDDWMRQRYPNMRFVAAVPGGEEAPCAALG